MKIIKTTKELQTEIELIKKQEKPLGLFPLWAHYTMDIKL
jgi:hypothetical protein